MDGAFINALAVPVTVLIALLGTPVALRRAGFAWSKVVFGTLATLVGGLGVANVAASSMIKSGLATVPLAWVVPLAMGVLVYRLSRLDPS